MARVRAAIGVSRRSALLAGITTISVGLATVAGAVFATVLFARRVVVPPKKRAMDLEIVDWDAGTITLSATIDSMTPGQYSLWFAGDTGHARVGEIVRYSKETVTRQIIGVDFGNLSDARRARMSGWFYLTPRDLGFEFEEVFVTTEIGDAPAWLIPADEPSERWVIQVHGRAVRRPETLRAVPVFRDAGYTSLIVSYRNDGDAPPTIDNRYTLGDSEWRDVHAAIEWALAHGAKSLVLMGWSMGGATVLQALTRSSLRDSVVGVVLESPVIDWRVVFRHHARESRFPRILQRAAATLLTRNWASRLTGLATPIDLERLDMLKRAAELDRPILILHSEGDDYVPPGASRALAEARPDIVTFENFITARHVKLWNYDSPRFNNAITKWLSTLVTR